MQIDCPTCARSYQVRPDALGAAGRTVICPACQTRWYVAASDDARRSVTSLPRQPIRVDTVQERRLLLASPKAAAPRRASGAMRAIAIGMTCACLLMLLIGKRVAVVTAAPRAAALYAAVGLPVNIRGLAFAGLKTTRMDDGSPRVEISGRIRNIADTRTSVPRITFDIRDIRGATLASWTESAPKRALADNESVPFVTQTPPLPEGYKDIVVRFTADADRETLLIPKTR